MNRRRTAFPVVVACVLVTAFFGVPARVTAAADNDAADRPAELKVLDRWIGEWDMEASVKPNEFFPQGSKTIFKTTIRWAINDRFIRCEAEGNGAQGERKSKESFSWVCTWDPNAKSYTSVVFWAN